MPFGRINASGQSNPDQSSEVNICFFTRTGELVELNLNTAERSTQGHLAKNGELIPESNKQFGFLNFLSPLFGLSLFFDPGSMRCWVCGGDVWIRPGTTSNDPCSCWGNRRRNVPRVSPERPQ